MIEQGGDTGRLPDDLADAAGHRLLETTGAGRLEALAALIEAHPQHAEALRRLHRDLDCVDGVIAGAYGSFDFGGGLPTDIGGYRVVRRLGEGAFGIVYLCAQQAPVARPVAVKVLRPDVGGRGTLQRFAAERQLLAALNHPAITQIFDAGELPDGRPFFVMEYVDGQPLHHYGSVRGLGLRDRLRLFADVCRGTAHAHARGIVHRDLKPANVLVVDTETGPMPKIIDFGIGKALIPAPAEDGAPAATEVGRIVGTPGYMSPEQSAGRTDEIDARSDVFSLGVMLYELLTDELPWPRGAPSTASDPQRPSLRIATHSPKDQRAAARRQRLAAELRGDLDWITAKALAHDRADRYPTAAALASDLERHLRGETVSVGPPSVLYRLQKFVRRNRVAVPAVLGSCLLASVAWFGWFAQANDTSERALEATAAVERLLARAGDERLQRSAENDSIRQSLAQDALRFYDQWLADRPSERRLRLGRCRALLSLSQVHWQLGQTPNAEHTAAEAVVEAQSLWTESPDDLAVRALLGDALRRNARAIVVAGRAAAGVPLLEQAIEHIEVCCHAAPNDHALSLSAALRELASVWSLLGRTDQCLTCARRSTTVLERASDTPGPSPRLLTDLVTARGYLGRVLADADRLDEAASVLAAAEAGLAELTIDRPRVSAVIHGGAAQLARRQGDTDRAIRHFRLAIAAEEQWRQAEPARWMPGDALMTDLAKLGKILDASGDLPEADATLQRAIEVAESLVAVFPDGGEGLQRLHDALLRSSHLLYDRLRVPDLALAERWARRAVEVGAEIARRDNGSATGSPQASVLLALILDARGEATGDLWDRLATELDVDADTAAPRHELDFAGWLGIARNHLRRGQLDPARTALRQAERWVGNPPRHAEQALELEWAKSRAALQAGDTTALVAAAGRMLVVRPTWMGRWRAADCWFDAWQLTLATPGHDPDTALAYRDAAAEHYRETMDATAKAVADEATDPWHVVPWGFSGLRLAHIETDAGHIDAARNLLDAAFAGLAAVADLAHRDLWRPEAFAAAEALRATLAAGHGR